MYLFLETEQTGLPKDYKASYKLANNWPRIIKFSYILIDKKGNIVEEGAWLIDNKIEISAVTKITGINNAMLKVYGQSFNKLTENIERLFSLSQYVIGFQIAFDITLIKSELYKLNMNCAFIDNISIIDLGIETSNFLKLKTSAKIKYKLPKLHDLYLKLFGISLPDIRSLKKLHKEKECFFELKRLKLLIE